MNIHQIYKKFKDITPIKIIITKNVLIEQKVIELNYRICDTINPLIRSSGKTFQYKHLNIKSCIVYLNELPFAYTIRSHVMNIYKFLLCRH